MAPNFVDQRFDEEICCCADSSHNLITDADLKKSDGKYQVELEPAFHNQEPILPNFFFVLTHDFFRFSLLLAWLLRTCICVHNFFSDAINSKAQFSAVLKYLYEN